MHQSVEQIAYGSEQCQIKLMHANIGCYILKNGIRILKRSDVQKAFGYEGKSENWLSELLTNAYKNVTISEALNEWHNAISYEISGGPDLITSGFGISPDSLTNVCQAIIMAKNEGYLGIAQLKYAKAATAILNNLNQVDISEAIGDATGYNFCKQNSIQYFQESFLKSTNDPVFEWIRTLPHDFFLKLFEIHGGEWEDLIYRPKNIGRIIFDLIFSRINDELLFELRNKKPKRPYKKKNSRPDNAMHPELQTRVVGILSLLDAAANNWPIFMQLVNRSYLVNVNFKTTPPQFSDQNAGHNDLSNFNKFLLRAT